MKDFSEKEAVQIMRLDNIKVNVKNNRTSSLEEMTSIYIRFINFTETILLATDLNKVGQILKDGKCSE
jgi:hypothetical protein